MCRFGNEMGDLNTKRATVIIPAAKIVPEELQGIGKLPAIIYPVGKKIVFDYLLEEYEKCCSSIEIICYEQSAKVHRKLSEYKTDLVRIKDLPELGDLGHTVYFGLEDIRGPVFINFSDTIVMDRLQDINSDCFFYTNDVVSDKWTYFEERDGVITHILDKSTKKVEGIKRLFVGVFKFSDAVLLRNCLEKCFSVYDVSVGAFYRAIMLYSQLCPLKAVKATNWFDIGHIDNYKKTQIEVKAREFNHISIDRDRGILRKSSENKEKFVGEILWYLKLPTDVEYVRPRIFSYSTDYNAPYVLMEYYAYHTIHELFLYGDLTNIQWRSIFDRILFVYKDFKRYSTKGDMIQKSLEEVYLGKTIKRLNSLKSLGGVFELFFNHQIIVNGVAYISLNSICKRLKEIIPKMLFDIDTFHIIHGDLCFANIMVDSEYSFIKVIDPRGKFGSFDIYGDTRYEIAKLLHSVEGKYDFIIKDLFDIEFDINVCRIDFCIRDRFRDFDLYYLFCDVFKEEIADNLQKIRLIEGLLFLSMIPLHGESVRRQMAMLGTGIELLDKVVDIRVNLSASKKEGET